LEWQRHSYIATRTQINIIQFGHTNTVGSTLWLK
jgi:hypothetical protein